MSKGIEIFAGAWRGVYIPQHFALDVVRENVTGVSANDYATLEAGPNGEWYWETWELVLNNARLALDGREWQLYQDGDLFVICYELIFGEPREE